MQMLSHSKSPAKNGANFYLHMIHANFTGHGGQATGERCRPGTSAS